MNKLSVTIPRYVDFISNWNEIYQTINFNQHIIINKVVTGCGFTEFFINNNIPTILCSPRKILLENKYQQHPNTYLVKNELEKWTYIDQDLGTKPTIEKEDKIDNLNCINSLKSGIVNYLYNCMISQIAPKILVTYDSLKHVLEIFNSGEIALKYPNLINQFQVVVDEFQSIFTDASFKASVELNFVGYLQSVPNVCYLSATPMLDKYLEQMDEFRELPYYSLIWDKTRLKEHRIRKYPTRSLTSSCCSIIEDYLAGKFPVECLDGHNLIESKEVVFYINSVTEIKKIINKMNSDPSNPKLTKENTNIICSDNKKNITRLKQLGFDLGTVPLKGQPHKMFTFCTRTVYLGADFYSTNASTVICSDSNIDCLALDISQDLPQIMGRQRLSENVFRNRSVFFYKEKRSKMTKEEFDAKIESKRQATKRILDGYYTMSEESQVEHNSRYRQLALINRYKEDYVGIQEATGKATYNRLVELRDLRSWEVSEYYKTHDTLYYAMINEGFIVSDYFSEEDIILNNFLQEFNKDGNFERRMKLYCELICTNYGGDNNGQKVRNLDIPNNFHVYYNFIGPDKIRSLGYHESPLRKIVDDARETVGNELYNRVYSIFNINEKIFFPEIKRRLQEVYDSVGLNGKAKAKDIAVFFEIKDFSLNDKATGKRFRGYELIKRLK